jgi:hypothetical protein
MRTVVPVVRHGDRLGEPLGLVVDAARADGVHVAPVVLGLRVHLGVAVHLARRREEEPRALGLGQAEAVVGAEAADLERLDGQLEVVLGRRGAGEVHHGVDIARHVDVRRHVVVHELERRVAEHAGEVVLAAGDQVVDGDDLVPPGQQRLADVRAEEPGSARDNDPHRR